MGSSVRAIALLFGIHGDSGGFARGFHVRAWRVTDLMIWSTLSPQQQRYHFFGGVLTLSLPGWNSERAFRLVWFATHFLFPLHQRRSSRNNRRRQRTKKGKHQKKTKRKAFGKQEKTTKTSAPTAEPHSQATRTERRRSPRRGSHNHGPGTVCIAQNAQKKARQFKHELQPQD